MVNTVYPILQDPIQGRSQDLPTSLTQKVESVAHPVLQPDAEELALSEQWRQSNERTAAMQTQIEAMQAQTDVILAEIKNSQKEREKKLKEPQTSLAEWAIQHKWTIIGGIVGFSMIGTIAKAFLAWSLFALTIGSLGGTLIGALACSRFDIKHQ